MEFCSHDQNSQWEFISKQDKWTFLQPPLRMLFVFLFYTWHTSKSGGVLSRRPYLMKRRPLVWISHLPSLRTKNPLLKKGVLKFLNLCWRFEFFKNENRIEIYKFNNSVKILLLLFLSVLTNIYNDNNSHPPSIMYALCLPFLCL